MNKGNMEILKEILAGKNGRFLAIALAISLSSSLVCAVVDFKDFPLFYLAAFYFYFTISSGTLFILLVHHIIGIKWIAPLRRIYENVAASSLYLSPLFIPILLGSSQLYKGSNPLFNRPIFIAVSAIILSLISMIALKVRNYSIGQDFSLNPSASIKIRRTAITGIIIYIFSLTAAAYYWIMSLEFPWFSGIFGLYHLSGSIQAGLALVGIIAIQLIKNESAKTPIGDEQWKNQLFLIFAFTLIHAYTSYSQYILILSPSLPNEIIWYSKRSGNGFGFVWIAIFLLRIAIPFLLLLYKRFRLNLLLYALLCSMIITGHLIEIYINAIPAIERHSNLPQQIWLLISAIAFLGAYFTLTVWRFFKLNSPFPLNLAESGEAVQEVISPISGGEIFENGREEK
ncbi:MAG: hypothetical protein ACP5T0_06280 [Verrucomicrobiia bacterium]